jgi:hypothetical protein
MTLAFPAVREALREAGVYNDFSSAETFLPLRGRCANGWLQSQ